jgi:hypothetical protein
MDSCAARRNDELFVMPLEWLLLLSCQPLLRTIGQKIWQAPGVIDAAATLQVGEVMIVQITTMIAARFFENESAYSFY